MEQATRRQPLARPANHWPDPPTTGPPCQLRSSSLTRALPGGPRESKGQAGPRNTRPPRQLQTSSPTTGGPTPRTAPPISLSCKRACSCNRQLQATTTHNLHEAAVCRPEAEHPTGSPPPSLPVHPPKRISRETPTVVGAAAFHLQGPPRRRPVTGAGRRRLQGVGNRIMGPQGAQALRVARAYVTSYRPLFTADSHCFLSPSPPSEGEPLVLLAFLVLWLWQKPTSTGSLSTCDLKVGRCC